MSQWYTSKLVRLSELSDEMKRDVLSEMTIKLRSLGRSELEDLTCNIDFTGLFAHLTSDDRFDDKALIYTIYDLSMSTEFK